jgi:alpha-1,2-mannosyltransferase
MSSPDTSPSRRAAACLAGGLVALFVLISVQYTHKVLCSERDNRSAILRWRDQIADLRDGHDIWLLHHYPNPPIMALLLEPVVRLPPLAGALTWFYLKAAMAVIAVLWTFRLVESADRPFPIWGKALAVVLSIRPMVGDLTHGNVNLFILFLVVGALYAFCRGRDLLAGLTLALAIACKITPALFVPYFAWKRAWRTLAGCALGLVLFFWLIPGSLLGMHDNARFLTSWAEVMVLPYSRGEVLTDHNNQSLPGLAVRLLTESPSFSDYVGLVSVGKEWHNLVTLDRSAVLWLVKGCMLAFGLLVLWSCRTPTTSRPSWRLTAEFSIVLLGMLLFSERTWKHHCVTLLVPFTALAYRLSAFGPHRRKMLIAALLFVLVLMASTSTGIVDRQDRFGKLAQTYGAYAWANLLLLAVLVALLRTRFADVVPASRLVEMGGLHARASLTTEAFCISGIGRPMRSVTWVSGSMPRR